MNTPATPDWEKEFDRAFSKWEIKPVVSEIKELFRTLLTQSRLQYQQELEEKVEKLLKTPEVPLTSTNVLGWERKGNNTGIRRVLALLKD